MASNLDSTMNKFNSLLEQSQKAMLCGPDCQKQETAKTLQQKYLDAQTNILTAPNQLNEAAKKYYTFTQGVSGYNTYVEKDLQTKVTEIANALTQNFVNSIKAAKTINETYSSQLINSQYAQQLYTKYLDENKELSYNLNEDTTDIFTNDRKTYYEEQGNDNLDWWYKIFFRLYLILLVAYIIFFFISSSNYSVVSKIFIFILLALYPFIAVPIFLFLMRLYHRFTSVLPKNAYLNI